MRQQVEIRTPGDWIRGGIHYGVIYFVISLVLAFAPEIIFGSSPFIQITGALLGFIVWPAIVCLLYRRSVMDGYRSIWLHTHAILLTLLIILLGGLKDVWPFVIMGSISGAMLAFAYFTSRKYADLWDQHYEHTAEMEREEAINIQAEAIVRAEQMKKEAGIT